MLGLKAERMECCWAEQEGQYVVLAFLPPAPQQSSGVLDLLMRAIRFCDQQVFLPVLHRLLQCTYIACYFQMPTASPGAGAAPDRDPNPARRLSSTHHSPIHQNTLRERAPRTHPHRDWPSATAPLPSYFLRERCLRCVRLHLYTPRDNYPCLLVWIISIDVSVELYSGNTHAL